MSDGIPTVEIPRDGHILGVWRLDAKDDSLGVYRRIGLREHRRNDPLGHLGAGPALAEGV